MVWPLAYNAGMSAHEDHRSHRVGWLRAAVLGANDGIVSTASLIVGVAAANASHGAVILAGVAGLVAGAMSMAAGEYVSVSSQADTEKADLELERISLQENPETERRELARIYVERGLTPELADAVSEQLMAHDALEAHARDEIGISGDGDAKPVQAALASAAAFTVGAGLPLLTAQFAPNRVSGGSWHRGGTRRWRPHVACCGAGHVLGSAGHGPDSIGRPLVWRIGLDHRTFQLSALFV